MLQAAEIRCLQSIQECSRLNSERDDDTSGICNHEFEVEALQLQLVIAERTGGSCYAYVSRYITQETMAYVRHGKIKVDRWYYLDVSLSE